MLVRLALRGGSSCVRQFDGFNPIHVIWGQGHSESVTVLWFQIKILMRDLVLSITPAPHCLV